MAHSPTAADKKVEETLVSIKAKYANQPPTQELFRSAVLDIANAFRGIREVGTTNSGYWIDKFLKDLGLNPGFAWCMGFVQYVFKQASLMLGIPDELNYNSAGTQAMADWAKKYDLLITDSASVSPGDIVIWRNGIGKNKSQGHTGIVIAVSPERYIVMEGNTSDSNWRDGGWVTAKTYKWTQFGEIGKSNPKDVDARFVRGFIDIEKLYNIKT